MSKVSSGNERGLGESRGRIFAIAFLTLLLAGCHSETGDQKYADAFVANMDAICDVAVEVETRPLPPTQGLTREQGLKRLADWTREGARSSQGCADRFRKLNAPSKFQQVNRLSIAMFQQMAEDESHFADLIELGSPASKVQEVFYLHLRTNLRRLTDEIMRIGGPEAARMKEGTKAFEEMIPKR